MSKLKGRSSSARLVNQITDLLLQILSRLPLKSLAKFGIVSKRWFSLVNFLCRTQNPRPVRALFLQYFDLLNYDSDLDLLPLYNTTEETLLSRKDNNQESGFVVLRSVNGLLLCARTVLLSARVVSMQITTDYYVYNPLTRHRASLKSLPRHGHITASLVYEPSKSPHYKVVVLCKSRSYVLKIMIYSSKTRSWRRWNSSSSLEPPGLEEVGNCSVIDPINNGVFWNGSVYYISCGRRMETKLLHRFDMETETMVHAHLPPGCGFIYLLTVSLGRLYLMVDEANARDQINVYEMENNEWCVKYNLNTSFDWDLKYYYSIGLAIWLQGDQNKTYISHCQLFFPPPNENGEDELWLSLPEEKLVLRCNLRNRSVIAVRGCDGVDNRLNRKMMAHEIMHSMLYLPGCNGTIRRSPNPNGNMVAR